MRKSCKTKHLSMVLSAEDIQIQMKLPTLQTPLAFKVLQENHMNLDDEEFAAKSFGYSKTLQSSNFWCLILLFLHLGINVPVLYVYMLFNTVWLLREMWAVSVNMNFLVFLVVSLGLCKTCSLLPRWLIGTTNLNSHAVTLTSARMFGKIRAYPLEIMGFLSVFGCIYTEGCLSWTARVQYLTGLWEFRPWGVWWFHSMQPNRPYGGLGWNQCTERKPVGQLCVLSRHSSGSARLVYWEHIPAEAQHELKGNHPPKPCPQRMGRQEGSPRVHSCHWKGWFPDACLF